MSSSRLPLLAAITAVAAATPSLAQDTGARRLQVSILPALSYNSDEGFGTGLVGGFYRPGDDPSGLYAWAIEPKASFTTGGHHSIAVMIDVPYVVARRGRITVGVSADLDCCQPYYGLGNDTPRDVDLAAPATGVNFYTYDRDRLSLAADLQWRLAPSVRGLAGLAVHRNMSRSRDVATRFRLDSTAGIWEPEELTATSFGGKVGVILDTRDYERDPHRGVWADALVWQGVPGIGDHAFTRVTGTVRAYVPVATSVTLAVRVLGEHIAGEMPLPMMVDIGSSFGELTGLGGSKSLRGVLRNRYLGRTRALGNLEVRWRGNPFTLAGQRWRLGGVAFADAGRVWHPDGANAGGWHWGRGGGLRITWGDAFVVALDVAHGGEAGLQTYVGLGHLF